MTQLEAARKTLFDKDALGVADIKLFPGTSREVTPEQMAGQVNNVIALIAAGDFDLIEDDFED